MAARSRGPVEARLAAACAAAAAAPSDPEAQLVAARACSRWGSEARAAAYYERAWRLELAPALRRRVLVGYAAALRTVGRADEAVALLGDALALDPDAPALRAVLGPALLSAGQPAAAVATLLGLVLELAPAEALEGQHEVLAACFEELLAGAVEPPA